MKFDPLEYLMLSGVDEQTAEDWITLRKAKKAPPTATAINMLAKQANQANMTLTQALELCCMNGWQGFKAEWVAPKGQTFTDRPTLSDERALISAQLTGRVSTNTTMNDFLSQRSGVQLSVINGGARRA